MASVKRNEKNRKVNTPQNALQTPGFASKSKPDKGKRPEKPLPPEIPQHRNEFAGVMKFPRKIGTPLTEKPQFLHAARRFHEEVQSACANNDANGEFNYDIHRDLLEKQKMVTKRVERIVLKEVPKTYQDKKLAILERQAVALERIVKIHLQAYRLEDLADE
ncbi:hypothetical protein MMC13_000460 [Lambiella insularis]|nr:hypothetical protein [Lambiella insularis]